LPEEQREENEAMLDKLYDQYKEKKKIVDRIRKRELGLASDEEEIVEVQEGKEEPLNEAVKVPPKPEHPVLVDAPTVQETREAKAERWFERTRLENDLMEDIEDEEIDVYEDVAGDAVSSDADEEQVADTELKRLNRIKKKRKVDVSGGSSRKKSKKETSKDEDEAFLASEASDDTDSETSDEEYKKRRKLEKEKKKWDDDEKKTIKKLKSMGLKVDHLLDKKKTKNRKQREKEAKQEKEAHGIFKEKDFARFIEVSASESWNSSDTDEVAEVLAMAKRMRSKKERLKIIEGSYCGNFRFNDQKGLPTWFLDDEERNTRPRLPITQEERDFFREQFKAVNARPIKKVAEAKARKKLRALRRWNKLKQSANMISDSHMMSNLEKVRAIERIYAKGRKGKERRKVQLVNMNGKRRKVMGRKGYKVVPVDRRMKVDKRRAKERERKFKVPRGKKGSARLRMIQKRPWLLKKSKN